MQASVFRIEMLRHLLDLRFFLVRFPGDLVVNGDSISLEALSWDGLG